MLYHFSPHNKTTTNSFAIFLQCFCLWNDLWYYVLLLQKWKFSNQLNQWLRWGSWCKCTLRQWKYIIISDTFSTVQWKTFNYILQTPRGSWEQARSRGMRSQPCLCYNTRRYLPFSLYSHVCWRYTNKNRKVNTKQQSWQKHNYSSSSTEKYESIKILLDEASFRNLRS